MDHFQYRGPSLLAEDVPLTAIAASYGTPCYVYSKATLERHFRAFDEAFFAHEHVICYAVKANSNLAVLSVLARLGSGFDIVSVGELERVLMAGGDPLKIVFSGVGKREDEMRRALQVGIRCFNVEVPGELDRLNQLAGEMGVKAPISLRVNPDVDAGTHPYISTGLRENKFGIAQDEAINEYRRAKAMPHLEVIGIDCHIGSQLTSLAPFEDALDRLLVIIGKLREEGISLRHIDVGGGLGIRYSDETPPEPAQYAKILTDRLRDQPYEIFVEPGRAIVGNAGVLLTRVEYLKSNADKHFAIVDAAMNDLIRPSLYQAYQEIIPVTLPEQPKPCRYDVVGPVCETGDFLGKDRELTIVPGDLLAVRSAGAYGFCMSSNYNSRPRVAEVLVDGDSHFLARKRETISDLFALESVAPV